MHITETFPNLPPAVALQTLHTLRSTLPPLPEETQAQRELREQAAIAAIAAFHPVDAAEALLAARIVSADANASDCLRLALLPGVDSLEKRRCRAQAISMMRESNTALRTLRAMQAAREKAETALQPAAMQRAGYWFREISVPAAPAQDEARAPEPPVETDLAAEADRYAVIYPDRAARIRALGRLPDPLDFGPPEPELVHAIVTGTSPTLRALDRAPTRAAA